MESMYRGPRARTYGWLISIVLACLLAACTPMSGRDVPPLFPTRTPVVPTTTATVPVSMPVSPTPTAMSFPTPLRTAAPLAPATIEAQAEAWLARAGLAGEEMAAEDWEAIQRSARAEGRVVLYSDTARMLTALESFLLANPGLDGEARVLTSDDAFLDLMQPLEGAGGPSVDVYLGGDGPLVMQALAQNRLRNYVPADLQPVIPEAMREPVLVHHWSTVILVQAGAGTEPVGIDSWWDLTREEWRGRVALPDPAIDKRSAYFFLVFAQHAGELAEAYRVEFGEELVLDDACPDAACQWMSALIRNNAQILASDAEVAAWVSDPAAPAKRVGICGSEQLAKVQRGKASLSPVPELAPAAGLYWPTYLAMVVGGEHPYAARVMIRWLMSDAVGDGAMAPWNEAGLYSPREDAADPPGSVPGKELAPRLWRIDAQFALDHQSAVNAWLKQARAGGATP